MKNKCIGLLLTLTLALSLNPTYVLATDNYRVAVSVKSNQATVTGSNTSYGGKDLTLRVVDKYSRNILADQVKAGASGSYSFGPYTLSDGDYTAYVGGVDAPEQKEFSISSQQLPPSDSGGGNGSSGGSAVVNSESISANGGTVLLNGAQIDVPAGAVGSHIKITVDKVSNPSTLPVNDALKLVSDVYELTKDQEGLFTKPIVITLPFDLPHVDLDKSMVGVYWLNEQTKNWVQLDNLQVDRANGKASGSVNHFTKFAVLVSDKKTDTRQDEVSFTDMKGHWAEASVRELVKQGAINGYSDHTFKPDNNMTRAEFVTVIVKAFNLVSQDEMTFNDTSAHWAKREISMAAAQGVVSGYSENTFGPDDLMTREQMAAMVIRAAKMDPSDKGLPFSDSSQVSDWARTALATSVATGLMNGYEDNTLKPQANTTRAEAVAVILRALELKK